jgi:multidrug efflux pump subunit AcrA (membrane-fusion protein)
VQGGTVFVWDPAREAARGVAVEIVQRDGDDVVVRGELSVAQRVILEPVREGERVREGGR